MGQYGVYPDAFYRVSVKAVIRNDSGHVLCVTETERDLWELPGGGLDHGETIQQGLSRELAEEIGYIGTFTYSYADISTLYDPGGERCIMNIVFDVILDSPDSIQPGKDVFQMEYKDPKQFRSVNYRSGQLIYKHVIDRNFSVRFDQSE
ncbi:NUDIX hydrolase [Candidatus Saccharibacteria bacterium]|nr:MAG: NUDIX hydrolase [Candidatus Saccharibacteria bacterium]